MAATTVTIVVIFPVRIGASLLFLQGGVSPLWAITMIASIFKNYVTMYYICWSNGMIHYNHDNFVKWQYIVFEKEEEEEQGVVCIQGGTSTVTFASVFSVWHKQYFNQ